MPGGLGKRAIMRSRAFANCSHTARSFAPVRGLGLLLGVELQTAAAAERAMYRSLELGLSFKVTMGSVLTLTPPLTISREDMDEAISILDRALVD